MVEDPEGEWGSAWYYDDELIYVHKKFVAIPNSACSEDEQGNVIFDRTKMTMIRKSPTTRCARGAGTETGGSRT